MKKILLFLLLCGSVNAQPLLRNMNTTNQFQSGVILSNGAAGVNNRIWRADVNSSGTLNIFPWADNMAGLNTFLSFSRSGTSYAYATWGGSNIFGAPIWLTFGSLGAGRVLTDVNGDGNATWIDTITPINAEGNSIDFTTNIAPRFIQANTATNVTVSLRDGQVGWLFVTNNGANFFNISTVTEAWPGGTNVPPNKMFSVRVWRKSNIYFGSMQTTNEYPTIQDLQSTNTALLSQINGKGNFSTNASTGSGLFYGPVTISNSAAGPALIVTNVSGNVAEFRGPFGSKVYIDDNGRFYLRGVSLQGNTDQITDDRGGNGFFSIGDGGASGTAKFIWATAGHILWKDAATWANGAAQAGIGYDATRKAVLITPGTNGIAGDLIARQFTATNGIASLATNIVASQNAAGYTNTGPINMVANVSGTSGTYVFYNRSGTFGTTVAGTSLFTNTLVATGNTFPVPVNSGFQVVSGVGVTIQLYAQ